MTPEMELTYIQYIVDACKVARAGQAPNKVVEAYHVTTLDGFKELVEQVVSGTYDAAIMDACVSGARKQRALETLAAVKSEWTGYDLLEMVGVFGSAEFDAAFNEEDPDFNELAREIVATGAIPANLVEQLKEAEIDVDGLNKYIDEHMEDLKKVAEVIGFAL